MKIKKYYNFINEDVIASEIFKDVLQQMSDKGNKIAKYILDNIYEYYDDSDINFIDFSQNTQMISYLPFNKRPKYKKFSDNDFMYLDKNRVDVKVGRAIRKILEDIIKNRNDEKSNENLTFEYSGPGKFCMNCLYLPKKSINVEKIENDSVFYSDMLLTNVDYNITVDIQNKKYKYSSKNNFIDRISLHPGLEPKGTSNMLKIYMTDEVVEVEDNDSYITMYTYLFDDNQKLKRSDNTLINAWVNIKISYSPKLKDSDIEKFVNEYVAISKLLKGKGFKITEVKGEEIRQVYTGEEHVIGNIGQLGNSCMVGKNPAVFDLYVKNPEVVSMLVLRNDEGKLLGRALLWKLTNGEKFMDRIYTISDSDINLFENYAIKNKFYYRSSGSNEIKIFKNGKKVNDTLTVQLKDIKYKKYPYLDTVCYYDETLNTLTNKEKNKNGRFSYNKILRSANGDYDLPVDRRTFSYNNF